MNDLIRRKDAIDYFVTNIGVVDADGYAVEDYDERGKAWTERFSGIPSVELEQKNGEWKPDKSGNVYWICSACGFASEAFGANILYHFCPSCGAKMRSK